MVNKVIHNAAVMHTAYYCGPYSGVLYTMIVDYLGKETNR